MKQKFIIMIAGVFLLAGCHQECVPEPYVCAPADSKTGQPSLPPHHSPRMGEVIKRTAPDKAAHHDLTALSAPDVARDARRSGGQERSDEVTKQTPDENWKFSPPPGTISDVPHVGLGDLRAVDSSAFKRQRRHRFDGEKKAAAPAALRCQARTRRRRVLPNPHRSAAGQARGRHSVAVADTAELQFLDRDCGLGDSLAESHRNVAPSAVLQEQTTLHAGQTGLASVEAHLALPSPPKPIVSPTSLGRRSESLPAGEHVAGDGAAEVARNGHTQRDSLKDQDELAKAFNAKPAPLASQFDDKASQRNRSQPLAHRAEEVTSSSEDDYYSAAAVSEPIPSVESYQQERSMADEHAPSSATIARPSAETAQAYLGHGKAHSAQDHSGMDAKPLIAKQNLTRPREGKSRSKEVSDFNRINGTCRANLDLTYRRHRIAAPKASHVSPKNSGDSRHINEVLPRKRLDWVIASKYKPNITRRVAALPYVATTIGDASIVPNNAPLEGVRDDN